MSEALEVNDLEELLGVIDRNPDVVVDFTAPSWCAPCRQFAPHFEKAAAKSDALFVVVDIDEVPKAATEFNVKSVPTVARFLDGKRVDNVVSRTVIKLLDELSA